jgi:AcrR family transcriptional regulator
MVAPVPIELSHAATRQTLLESAGEVFAEFGFHAATVREICQRAGANIAAVNYHFGDKEKLYLEVLRYAQRYAAEKYPTDFGITDSAPPEDKLKAFIRSFLLRIFDEGPLAWHGKIMAREMIDPTGVLDTLVEERIRPQAAQLNQIIRQFLPDANADTTRQCAMSVVGQCLFYCHCRPVVARLHPQQKYTPADIEKLAEHITEFSAAALKQLGRKKK